SVAVTTLDSSYRTKDIFHGFGHNEQVDQVSFHPNNTNLFASASSDRTIRIWDVRQTRTHTRLPTKVTAQNLNVAWSPCGTYLFYGDKEDTISMVDGRSLKTLKMESLKEETNEFAFHPNGKYLFVALGGGQLSIYKMPEFALLRTVQAHSAQSTCACVAVSPDGERFAVGASDALCSLWDTRQLICERSLGRMPEFTLLRTVQAHSAQSTCACVAVSPDGERFAVGASDALCSLWDTRQLICERSLGSADSRLIATASEDHSIDIAWADTGARVCELRVNAETYTCAWHPNAYLLAYSSAPAIDSRDREVTVRLFGFAA
ncbi:THO complex subunit 3, partial [Toxocara canis]